MSNEILNEKSAQILRLDANNAGFEEKNGFLAHPFEFVCVWQHCHIHRFQEFLPSPLKALVGLAYLHPLQQYNRR